MHYVAANAANMRDHRSSLWLLTTALISSIVAQRPGLPQGLAEDRPPGAGAGLRRVSGAAAYGLILELTEFLHDCQVGMKLRGSPGADRDRFTVCSWTVPSNIGVSGFGGQSLFGLLTQSIGEELAHFPTGPALSDKFWWAARC